MPAKLSLAGGTDYAGAVRLSPEDFEILARVPCGSGVTAPERAVVGFKSGHLALVELTDGGDAEQIGPAVLLAEAHDLASALVAGARSNMSLALHAMALALLAAMDGVISGGVRA